MKTYQDLWDVTKAVFQWKFTASNVYSINKDLKSITKFLPQETRKKKKNKLNLKSVGEKKNQ